MSWSGKRVRGRFSPEICPEKSPVAFWTMQSLMPVAMAAINTSMATADAIINPNARVVFRERVRNFRAVWAQKWRAMGSVFSKEFPGTDAVLEKGDGPGDETPMLLCQQQGKALLKVVQGLGTGLAAYLGEGV